MRNNFIREFLDNDEFKIKIDGKLDQLITDTCFYSSFELISDTVVYKELISYGNRLVPYLVSKILTTEKPYIVFYNLLFKNVKINIKEENSGSIIKMKDDVSKWWDINKVNYGE
jgi:hypothetical protein